MFENRVQEIKKVVVLSLREHSIFVGIVCVYCLSAELLGWVYGVADSMVFRLYSVDLLNYLKYFLVLFCISHSIYVMIVIHPRRLLVYLWNEWRCKYLKAERIVGGLIVLFFLPLFMSVFSSLKTIIPVINPFLWDEILAETDQFIHFGKFPWQIIQPLCGKPFLSNIINVVYNLWAFLMYGLLVWQSFSVRDRALRMQYLLTFLLLWVVPGSILATIFASVGPCYYGKVVDGINPFADLMQYLWMAKEQYPMWALDMQDKLWQGYQLTEPTQGGGISAMPSLHIATSVLFALLGWRTDKILGIVLTLFCCIIFIGSIHLGWHYAIDGYVSIILTILIWQGTGWFVQHHIKGIDL